MALHETLTRCG